MFNNDGAIFSDCRKYRYVLWRIWDASLPMVAFVGLNPSTANEGKNDPTIRRVISFANDWGYGGVYMLNLFAYVSAYPNDLLTCEDAIGENDRYLLEYSGKAHEVVYAYGSFKQAKERAAKVHEMLPKGIALSVNKDGSPKHPLYVPSKIQPVVYE